MPNDSSSRSPDSSPDSQKQSLSRQLFSLSAPIIGLNLLAVTMLAVDTAMCGRLPDPDTPLTALGFAVQIVFLLMVAMFGLMVGTVALVARAFGGGDAQRMNHLLVQSTMLTVLIGVVFGVTGAILAEPILRVLGASPPVAEVGAAYLRVLMLGTPFAYLMLLYGGVMRGVGNTRLPFLCALAGNLVNVILDYGLILGHLGMPALGVTGAAIGTVVAQVVNVLLLVAVFRRRVIPSLYLPLRVERIDRALAIELFRVGWPAALDVLIINIAFLAAISMLGHLEEVMVAAHGIGLRVQALAFVPGWSIGQATAAMVGQALGAGDVARAREVTRASIALCCTVMTLIGMAFLAAAHPIVHVFDVAPGTALEAYSVEWIRILGLAMLPAGVFVAIIGLLQGAGATNTGLRINVVATLCLQVPLAAVLAFPLDLGALGVWLSFPLASLARVTMLYIAYKRERWAVTGIRIQPVSVPD